MLLGLFCDFKMPWRLNKSYGQATLRQRGDKNDVHLRGLKSRTILVCH
jgi:hypothetical protein